MNAWKRTGFAWAALLVLALVPAEAAFAQVRVTAANPASAPQGTFALDVVVSGNGFDPSAKVAYFVSGTTNPGGVIVRKVSYRNSKELVTTIDVDDVAVLAYYDIQVTLQSGRKGKGTTLFSVTRKSGSVDSYVAESLGTFSGDQHSDGWGINSSGHVVGRSYADVLKAFYWNGTMHQLLMSAEARATAPTDIGWDVEAWAISDGPDEIVVGKEDRVVCESTNGPCESEQWPVLWQGDLTHGPAATRLDCGPNPGRGTATGISRAGTTAVGSLMGAAGAVWKRASGGWNLSQIPLTTFPCDSCQYDWGIAFGANDEGLVVGLVSRQDNYLQHAYVYDTRTATGALLPMPPGYPQSNAKAVSKIVDGRVYVAGVVWPCEDFGRCEGSRAIRWTVDVGTFAASLEVLDMAGGHGVTDQGHIIGTRRSVSGKRRYKSTATAFLWKSSVGYIPLEPAQGHTDSDGRGLAVGDDGAFYIVGDTYSQAGMTAARWIVR